MPLCDTYHDESQTLIWPVKSGGLAHDSIQEIMSFARPARLGSPGWIKSGMQEKGQRDKGKERAREREREREKDRDSSDLLPHTFSA